MNNCLNIAGSKIKPRRWAPTTIIQGGRDLDEKVFILMMKISFFFSFFQGSQLHPLFSGDAYVSFISWCGYLGQVSTLALSATP